MATSQQDVDWQSTKNTVLERSRHMFNNPFLSDVTFSCEGSDKKFFAHKYVLATSSAVFYAMFYGELVEKNSVINLSDTNDKSLEEFLRFLYTDECNLTADNVLFVLNSAMKYFVPLLAQKCIAFLEANLVVENAFTILQQAIQFNEQKLERKCWYLIDPKTSEAISSAAFVDINQATLEKLVERESLNVKEVDLFIAVLNWSEAECLRKKIKANGKNKRAVMKNAIHQIRFASMTAQEFSLVASKSGILTPDEMVLFYQNISGVTVASDVWNLSERGSRIGSLLRCRRFGKYCSLSGGKRNSAHTLCISFSKPVILHGVRLLGEKGQEYYVRLDVLSQSIGKKFRSQSESAYGISRLSGFDVMLPVPIQIQANTIVQLKATFSGRGLNFFGSAGRKRVDINGITVNFFDTPGASSASTSVEFGQFDEIIFCQ